MFQSEDRGALKDGLIAVTAFAATLPLTRIALDSFAPLPLTFGRLLGASIAAMLLLRMAGASWPKRHQLAGLLLVALGGVIGFPLLTAFALDGREAAPAAIPLALMPLATAAWSRFRGHETPSYGFWLWAIAGSTAVLHFVWISGTTLAAPQLFIAGLAAAIAYAEGGRLAQEMPGWQVMAWALVLTVPVAALGFGYTWARQPLPSAAAPWMALAFLALITQLGAFWFWYRALATGVSRTSQLQLLQPFLTLLLAATLLGEPIAAELWLYAAAVVVTVYLARSRATQHPTALQAVPPVKETNP
jgi:drug/metabolite transporter (DMT)-like permease